MRKHNLSHLKEQDTKYGTYKHLNNEEQADNYTNYFLRISEYISKGTGERETESHKAESLKDETDIVSREEVYNSKCASCYFSHSHTRLKHDNSIKRAEVNSKHYTTREEYNNALKAAGI